MKIFSYNIRSLRCRAKCNEVREFIKIQKTDFACIQETRKEVIDEFLIRSLWGQNRCGWAYRESEGRSGGIISLWNLEVSSASSSWYMKGAVVVNGFWRSERIECCIVNVYASCQVNEKIELWDRL